ncbi:MAG: response regulator transcription factor [Gammaproteobacteria bacterium]|nr:response regulator transcription factor [Gammaproteobacteria bacterium]
MSSYTVLIADDHPLYRGALKNVVLEAFDDVVCIESDDIPSTLAELKNGHVDLVLLDLFMPGVEGLAGLRQLKEQEPMTPVIISSAHDEPDVVREAFKCGASGYLPKSSGAEVTVHALNLVRSGGVYVPSEALLETSLPVSSPPPADNFKRNVNSQTTETLTPRQFAVLNLLGEGLSNKAIARDLGIREITVKAHVSAILRKLGVDNRLQAVLAAGRKQLRE